MNAGVRKRPERALSPGLVSLALILVAGTASAQDDLDFLLGSEPQQAPAGDSKDDAPDAPQTTPGAADSPAADVEVADELDVIRVAEDPPPPVVRERPTNRLVEEIVVTAQKREENLRDVPISVQAFSGDKLDALGVDDPTKLSLIVPALNFSNSIGFAIVYLRGLGSDVFLLGDPSVAYYIDDIYFPFGQGLAQNFGNVERIEVLKGPQGTLFGRNAVGGAISIHTPAPDFEVFSGSVQSSVGAFNSIKNRGYVNLPLGESMAMSVSAYHNREDFYMDGVAAGQPLEPVVAKGARVKMAIRPTDTLEIELAALRSEQDGAGSLFQLNYAPSPLLGALIQPQTGYDGELSAPVDNGVENTVFYGRAEWTLPWLDIRVLTSDQSIENTAFYDLDGSPTPLLSVDGDLFGDVQTAELQLLSNDGTWGAGWLNWIAGVYYFRADQGYKEGLSIKLNLANPLLGPVTGLLDLPVLGDGQGPGINQYGQLGARSLAYFGQMTVSFTDRLRMTLGARYQSEERFIIESYQTLTRNRDAPALFPVDPDSNLLSDTQHSFSPKVGLEFSLGEETLLFLSWQEAVKSATYNTIKILARPDYVKPEDLTAYELGVKTRFLDGLVSFDAAVFHYTLENFQIQYANVLGGGGVNFENADESEVRGFDFDSTVVLFPQWFDGLVMTLGAAYLDARFTEYSNGTGYSDVTGLLLTGQDFSGHRIPRAPRWSGSASLTKVWLLGRGELELSGDVYHSDEFFFTAQNSEVARQAGYEIYGARLSYYYDPWQLRVTAFGENLADTFYTGGVFQIDTGVNRTLAPPRTYGLRLNWAF